MRATSSTELGSERPMRSTTERSWGGCGFNAQQPVVAGSRRIHGPDLATSHVGRMTIAVRTDGGRNAQDKDRHRERRYARGEPPVSRRLDLDARPTPADLALCPVLHDAPDDRERTATGRFPPSARFRLARIPPRHRPAALHGGPSVSAPRTVYPLLPGSAAGEHPPMTPGASDLSHPATPRRHS